MAQAPSKQRTGRVSQIAIERRRDLLQAAIRSISEHGYGAVTVATICEAAGFSRGLIGHYFDSKEDLLLQAIQEISSDLARATRDAVEAAGPDRLERLRAVVRASFTSPGFTPEKVSVWVALTGTARWSPPLATIYHDLWRGYREGIGRLMKRAADDRGLKFDHRLAALTFSQLVEGFWVGWAADPDTVSPEAAQNALHAYLDLLFGTALVSEPKRAS